MLGVLMREEQIPGHPGYKVRPNGEVINMFDRVLTPMTNLRGLLFVGLYYHGVKHNRSVALLVANAFLEPHSNPQFDTPVHLDGDRTNCDVNNLMWRPRWFAVKWHRQFDCSPVRRFGYQLSPLTISSSAAMFPPRRGGSAVDGTISGRFD